jgi:hypothetical protein
MENDVQGHRHHPISEDAGESFHPEHPNPSLPAYGTVRHSDTTARTANATADLHTPCRLTPPPMSLPYMFANSGGYINYLLLDNVFHGILGPIMIPRLDLFPCL